MFTDGRQGRDSNHGSRDESNRSSAAESLKAQINIGLNKIHNGLANDLTKSLVRLTQAIRRASKSGGSSASSTDYQGESDLNLKKEPTKDKKQEKVAASTNSSKLRHIGQSVRMRSLDQPAEEKQRRWVPSLKSSLQRSFSLHHTRLDGRTATDSWRRSSRVRAEQPVRRFTANSQTKLISTTRRRFMRDLTFQYNRCDTWLSAAASRTAPTIALFILANLLLVVPLTVSAAPLPVADLQPIWLQDALMSVDPESLEMDVDPASVYGYWSAQGATGQPMATGDLQGEDLLWVQRRRLNRDRALEPPPWLRQQPMRRASPSMFGGRETIGPESDPQLAARLQEMDLSEQRPTRGRKSRESIAPISDQIYGELFGQLVGQALESQSIMDEIYDELELRAKANQRMRSLSSGLQASAPSAVLAASEVQQPQLSIPQALQRPQDSSPSAQDATGQVSDSDATLVVAGDDVSSSDDITPLDVSSLSQPVSTSVAYQQPNPVYGDIISGQKVFPADLATAAPYGAPSASLDGPQMMDADTSVSEFIGQPGMASVGSTLSVDSVDKQADRLQTSLQQQQLQQQQQQQSPSLQSQQQQQQQLREPKVSSFHVVEDIDQTDNSQDAQTVLIPPEGGDENLQQLREQSEWISLPTSASLTDKRAPAGANRRDQTDDVLSGYKRSSTWRKQYPADQALDLDDGSSGMQLVEQQLAELPPQTAQGLSEMAAISMIESGYVSKEYLFLIANKLKVYLEDMIGIPRDSILGLFPLNPSQLLVKLDSSRFTPYQMISMIKNYDYARGFIVASWPLGSPQNPLPLLTAILRVMAQGYPSAESVAPLERDEQAPELADEPAEPIWDTKKAADLMLASGERVANRRGRLAALAAYLSAMYADAPPAWRQGALPVGMAAPLVTDGLTSARLPLVGDQAEDRRAPLAAAGWLDERHSLQILVLLLAVVAAYVAVKLVLQTGGRSNQYLKRRLLGSAVEESAMDTDQLEERRSRSSWRSVWSASHESTGATVGAGAGKQASDAPPSAAENKQLDLLTQRLARLLYLRPAADKQDDCLPAENSDDGRKELDEASAPASTLVDLPGGVNGGDCGAANDDDDNDTQSGFRSSHSYIKSLIEVLARARSQLPMQMGGVGFAPSGLADEALSECPKTNAEAHTELSGGRRLKEHSSSESADEQQEPTGVLMSQMDISAAHLILAYMEKHLEDKERLRREWLELNAAGSSGAAGQATARQGDQALQRQARTALSPENKHKNRNCSVVPFDRNRVKLAASSSVQSQSQSQTGSRSILPAGSYINASYIYDDDLRRPTHIIAQGPTEQTCAQFWQMVWQEGISVIVMLTRLNENGTRMCHSYWPTGSAADKSPSSASQTTADAASATSTGCSKGADQAGLTSGTRRGSVTSVLSGGAARTVSNLADQTNSLVLTLDAVPAGEEADGRAGARTPPVKLEVHLVSEHVSSSDYLVRNMYLINRSTGERRTVSQFHYLAWPDDGVPENPRSLLQFRRKVHKSYRNLKSPILVHCSDGAGRSGTYTLIDIILERIKNGAKEIDPRATLEHLRDQRVGLCSNQKQFEFVLVALAQEIQIILNALPH